MTQPQSGQADEFAAIDPVKLTADLVRCPSVTPEEAGALGLLERELAAAGFTCTRVDRNGVCNLFARWGEKGHARTFGFNGHTDVVPVGDLDAWTTDPFGAEVRDGLMFGRGTTDMKSGVAAFAAAAANFVRETPPDGSIILAITGDEEGLAVDGTVALLDWMKDTSESMSVCLVGEPTCPDHLGQAMKIGRRGSMTGYFTATGLQGHAAYPHLARNPVPALATLMSSLAGTELDRGTDHFDPTTLAVTTFDTGNPANNVIPAACTATVNIRFNDSHSSASLTAWMQAEAEKIAEATGISIALRTQVSGESFFTPPGALSSLVSDAVAAETGVKPELSTSGGTSDARFVKSHCPVVEFGLVGKSMHKVDEHVDIEQIRKLTAIYTRILKAYFAG